MKDFITLNHRNVRVWFLMAFQAGVINAGGFLACKRFVTHTTGMATHFAYELANWHLEAAFGMLTVPLFFLLGAMITSYFVDLPHHRQQEPNFRMPALLIMVCLIFAMCLGEIGAFGIYGENSGPRDYTFMALLCLASGLQNAMITNANGVVVRTTHLTGITTDLAAGFVRLLFPHDRKAATTDRDRMASIARLGIILSFISGSAASAFLFLKAEYLGFMLPVFTSFCLLIYFIRRTTPRMEKL
jgi:uncharacterized membrane protein YoaK (UPF0700 family)